jgi:GH24 family phage-related lysozyme (muramidase)
MEVAIELIRQVKAKHERSWRAIEGVVAVGIGTTSDGTIGVIISVREMTREVRERIPARIEGVPIEVEVTGEIRAL